MVPTPKGRSIGEGGLPIKVVKIHYQVPTEVKVGNGRWVYVAIVDK